MTEENPPGQANAQVSISVPAVTYAMSANRSGTLSVRATDQGLPVDIHIDRRELRYGAEALAADILRLTRTAAVEARVRRRDELAEAGVSPEILDRLSLPTRAEAERAAESSADDPDSANSTWMRRV